MTAKLKNAGAMAKYFPLLAPVANDGTLVEATSAGLCPDRCPSGEHKEYLSAKMFASAGLSTGTPTSFSFPFKLQTSDALASGWADYTDPKTGSVPTVTLTAVSTSGAINVDLSNAKRYLRLSLDGTFVGGSSPTLQVSAGIVLMGSTQGPVS